MACCQELWALIMDAGTGFTAQVYNLNQQFLPKVCGLEDLTRLVFPPAHTCTHVHVRISYHLSG